MLGGEVNWQFGTIGEWVAGVGALVAIGVTVWLWHRDRDREAAAARQRRADADAAEERRRIDAAVEDERRRQRTLSTWFERRRDRDRQTYRSGPVWYRVIVVANVGSDVIDHWDVEVAGLHDEGDTSVVRWHGLLSSALEGALPPGARREGDLDASVQGAVGYGLPVVTFTDALGSRWRRQSDDIRPASEAAAMRAESERAAFDDSV